MRRNDRATCRRKETVPTVNDKTDVGVNHDLFPYATILLLSYSVNTSLADGSSNLEGMTDSLSTPVPFYVL